ncbi:PREDICTED: uncharacterized protein LOC109166896 [Ipomoea nil]|uniref:uncharacterized protein LOC109166896 n=1 Tax=Ipomoea nil TaxID=35883 RepID=UPI000900C714|nr:PREDICTED: uncharacterized protein LOC109166896 [Ipomoea nil]
MENPFLIYVTRSERAKLFRKIIDVESPLSPEATDKVLATIKSDGFLLEGLTDKEKRQMLALARHISATPWPFPPVSAAVPDSTLPGPASLASSQTVVLPALSSPLNTSRKIDFDVSLPDQFVSPISHDVFDVQTLPVPGDPYDPLSHNLPRENVDLVALSDLVNSLPSAFSIRNVAQHVSVPTVACSAFSIPITIAASKSHSDPVPIPISSTQESVPIISVPIAKSSRKGKEKISVSGTAEKRGLSQLDDVETQTDHKLQRKGSTLPPRTTWSRAQVDTHAVPTPSGSKSKGSSKVYKPHLLSPDLFVVWKTHVNRVFIVEKSINEEDLAAKCNIIPLLRYQNLLAPLRHIGPYSTWLARFHQVFIRGTWYPFGPTEINAYLGTPNHPASPDPSPHLLATALTHNKVVSWSSDGISSLKLTTVYSVLLRLASANWVLAVRRHQKEAKVHLPFPCLIYGVLQDHGFMPYKEEVITTPNNAYIFDDRLKQRGHYDDRASLDQLPAIPPPAPLVSAPASSTDTTSASRPGSRLVPKEPPTLVDRRQIVLTLEASIAQVQQSVTPQQATISGLAKLRDAQLEEIARIEAIHARVLADTGAASSDSDSEDEEDDSDSGTPSARAIFGSVIASQYGNNGLILTENQNGNSVGAFSSQSPAQMNMNSSPNHAQRAADEFDDPWYLHITENPNLILVSPPLSEVNYASWSRSMKIALEVKNKFGFADGSILKPEINDPKYTIWKRCNNIVCSWIFKSLSPTIAEGVLYLEVASDVWNTLKKRYSQVDSHRIAELQNEIL